MKLLKNRGRPHKELSEKLRTMVWYSAVSIQSKIKTAYGLEARYSPDSFLRGSNKDKISRPNKWDRYKKGVMTPKDIKNGLIEKVELDLPGTSYWFRHPIWKILSKNSHTKNDLYEYLDEVKLPKRIKDNLLVYDNSFQKIKPNYDITAEIYEIQDLDGLFIGLYLYYMGLLLDVHKVSYEGLYLFEYLLKEVSEVKELESILSSFKEYAYKKINIWGSIHRATSAISKL